MRRSGRQRRRRSGSAFPRGSARWAFPAALLLALLCPAAGRAQQIEFTPRPNRPAERQLDRFLRAGHYQTWAHDTVLAPGVEVQGDVLVLEATARVSGHVHGSVYVVNGDLFLRPSARIDGDVLALGGGYYSSTLAHVQGNVVYQPNDVLNVIPHAGGYQIYPVEETPQPFRLHGALGFDFPHYDRVDGWTFSWGATARATPIRWQPSLDLTLRYRTDIQQLEGTVRQSWYPTGRLNFGFELERTTTSREGWIRSDLSNSAAFLLAGNDYRDWYRADRAAFFVGRLRREQWSPSLRIQWEQASSLVAHEHAVLFANDSDVRPNPAVDDGRIWSVVAELGISQSRTSSSLKAHALLEGADSTVAGDFSFLLGEARASWKGELYAGHELELFGIVRGDLAGRLPAQRWSALGGSGTLPTADVLEFRGPRLAFGRARYLVPLHFLSVPGLGQPKVFVQDALGSAWGPGEGARFHQDVGAGLRFFLVDVGGVLDPSRGGSLQLLLVGRLPGDL